MTLVWPYKRKSAANTAAMRAGSLRETPRRWAVRSAAVLGMLSLLLGVASSASALILTGGPVDVLPGGGSCTTDGGVATQTGGVTVSCTGVNLGAHTKVYFGIKNATNVNGNTMTGTAPAASTTDVFRFGGNTTNSITYTSTTTINDLLNGSQSVDNRLVLTLTAGTATIVATGGLSPANNGNGDIERVFQITSGSFSIRVDVDAKDAIFNSYENACFRVYDPTHTPASTPKDISKVDLAFYYSDCGDSVVDSPEQCDLGTGVNGDPSNCCNSDCTFRASGQICRAGAGAPCDANETCTGAAASCPPDDAPINSGVVCRSGSGDSCDQNETCTGVPGQGCPADDAPGNAGVVCRASTVGDFCDEDEVCTGIPLATCPPDDVPGKLNVVCRAGSGDICDPDERCTGIKGQGCPADVVANPTTVCRAGSGDSCDPDELCTAIAGQPCPADIVQPSGTECRAAAGSCDVAETCSGSPGQACPADAFKAAAASCNDDADVCTVDECDGSGNCVFAQNLDCDDTNACTQDSCDPINGCEYTGTPATTCVPASKAVFKYKDKDTNSRDKVVFVWKGGPFLVEDMGDPVTGSTRYELCVYDQNGVQMAVGVPPGTGWDLVGTPSSPKGYKYKNRVAPYGIKLIKTKGSNLDRAKAKVVGKGTALPDGVPSPFLLPLTAQLYASDGECWEAEFDDADPNDTIRKNEDGKFIGKTKIP